MYDDLAGELTSRWAISTFSELKLLIIKYLVSGKKRGNLVRGIPMNKKVG
jgi:hypothetical protein